MKNRIIHLAIIALAVGILGTACNSQQKKTDDLQRLSDSMEHPHNAVDTLNNDRKDWEKFKIEAQVRISRNQDSINAFKSRMAMSKDKAKAKYQEKVTLLEEVNQQLKKRVDEYQEEGKDKWDKFRHDFDSDMDTLGQRMKEVFTPEQK